LFLQRRFAHRIRYVDKLEDEPVFDRDGELHLPVAAAVSDAVRAIAADLGLWIRRAQHPPFERNLEGEAADARNMNLGLDLRPDVAAAAGLREVDQRDRLLILIFRRPNPRASLLADARDTPAFTWPRQRPD